ncbi:MAG: hypothetical protein A2Y13_12755 [Planctomycetes bacterium GWC2_45_44]|nr:MAG: hypothetical protein A2Y13_12755 [Planctomycetes bacterium GWC2_45_44]
MSKKSLILAISVLCLCTVPGRAEPRASENFVGLRYDCNELPSLANPVWDVPMIDPNYESVYANAVGGKLEVNVLASGSVSWSMPGEYGADWFRIPGKPPYTFLQGRGLYHYAYPDANNPWKTNYETGYTLEISTEVINSAAGQWGYCFYIGEGRSGNGALYDIEIFKDKITSGGAAQRLLYTGDLTGRQHKIRLVRFPGSILDPFEFPYVDLYVDGVKVYTLLPWDSDFETGEMFRGSWDQQWLYMGSLSGSARYHVKTDYIRADFTGPYEPYVTVCDGNAYPMGDFNQDCVVDLKDLQVMAQGWLLCSDPTDPSCMNCNNPANAEYCL